MAYKQLIKVTLNASFLQLIYPWLWVAISFGIMLVLNAIMWTFYTKAMQEKGGTLVATVVSSGTNYTVSALLGSVVFGETTSLIWWMGMSLVVAGLFVVNHEQTKVDKKE